MDKDSVKSDILKKMREEQMELAKKIILHDDFKEIKRVCGIDVAYPDETAICALSILDVETLRQVESKINFSKAAIPYIPTYLAFREFPAMKDLADSLDRESDILFVDGNGILHPRKCGLASYLGIKFDIITIGIAKSLLCGELKNEPKRIGEYSEVVCDDEVRGFGLKTSESSKLTFVSPGNRISLETSLDLTKRFSDGKIPEPLRRAHALAEEIKKETKNKI
jgi:deoxyribonuclease V